VIAHNGGKFDNYFVLNYRVKNGVKPETIYLFSKTFGLGELKKGYFPYYLNTPENETTWALYHT